MQNNVALRTLLAFAALVAVCPLAAAAEEESSTARGKYLVGIMDCGGCHTDGYLAGKPEFNRYLAGSMIGFGGPAGIVYPPNLTPSRENGIGNWSDEEIINAIRTGRRPDGRALAPVMPWPTYASLTDTDAQAIVDYLRTLPANEFRPPRPVAAGQPAPAPYLDLKPAGTGTDAT